jgi:predicted transposase YdaD
VIVIDELESSNNPFATVVMAHLKVHETKRSSQKRKAWKFNLTKALYEKGYERQQILDLYRFIDWVMILPEAVEKEFWQELQTFEEERKVTYVTNAERFGFERGIQEGRQEGRSLILRQLTRRLGTISSDAESQVRTLSQTQLESLGEALLEDIWKLF